MSTEQSTNKGDALPEKGPLRISQILAPPHGHGPLKISKSKMYRLMAEGRFPRPFDMFGLKFLNAEDVWAAIEAERDRNSLRRGNV